MRIRQISQVLPAVAVLFLSGTFCSCVAAPAAPAVPEAKPAYKDPALPVDRRVADLVGRMTLEEKVLQLRGLWHVEKEVVAGDAIVAGKAASLIGKGIGEIAPIRQETAREVALRNIIQKYLVENTRLGIPAIFHEEGCHGVLAPGATSFPIPIGLACSWDPEMAERIYTVVAREMRARGIQHALTPVIDVCREPRWGRTDETLGEDPYLNGKLGAAMVRGFQGGATGEVAPGHVATTLKHLTGHGQPQGGLNRSPADIPLRELYDIHLVPFRMAIAEAKPVAVMPSYNEVNGVPSHANVWLLQEVLRGEFKFDGLIASDYNGIEYLSEVHNVAADTAEAAALAFKAGVEVNLPEGTAFKHLQKLVEQGRIPMADVDRAVARVLRLKFALGLFENPYADPRQAIEITKLESSKSLALEAAQKSIVLLKNRNGILPLAKDKYKSIAVVGPNAVQARLGSYSGEPWYKVGILEGVRKKVGGTVKVLHAEGCTIVKDLPVSSMDAWDKAKAPKFPTEAENHAAVAAAVAVAKEADLILLVIGENEVIAREAWEGAHYGDRASLELFGAQNELARAMFALGKPVVVYLMNGKPLAIPEIADRADAIVEGWYMGQETGTAAADILFGDVNPSGKLTISFPRSTGHIPAYYNHKPGARIFEFIDDTVQPLYPFGFGLSYTTFSYSEPRLAAASIDAAGKTTVSVTVTNTGKVAGDEIVQMYIRDRVSSVTRPVKELKGFQRISLKPGESRDVVFTISPESLAFHDIKMNYVVEPGEFDVMVGPSSAGAGLKKTMLKVTGGK
jgi:beta-glucosidase